MKTIDLRSDTLTVPTPEMRKAMAEALVGDDVFEEDPTIHLLEQKTAEILGKKAALFTPTGTQSNLIASILLNPPGSEVIADSRSHLFYFECAGTARFAGSQIRPIATQNGILSKNDIATHIRAVNVHYPKTSSVFIENTHNIAGGKIYPIQTLKEIREICDQSQLKIHMDGARMFNASVKSNVPVSEIAKYTDTVTFCLSKGLGCPAGSILAGEKEFIREARKIRKALGGGMRQAGILAAAGIYALNHNIHKLKDDHEHAELIAKKLIELNQEIVFPETNIIIWRPNGSQTETIKKLKENGLITIPINDDLIRMVTSLNISRADVETAIKILEKTIGA